MNDLLNASLFKPSVYRTFFFVAIAATAFVAIDSVLARTERGDTAADAARFYQDGQRLMQHGKYADAADQFKSAIANARDNNEYPLALGQALLGAGQLDEASATLTELLNANSMAGAPNLAMARVFAKEARFDEAAFYYHRAIYGQWPQDASGNQMKARFELVDLLARHNSKPELLAELLPLQDEAPPDTATQEKLARLFLTAGSPARAITILEGLVHEHPQDPQAHEGLGDAAFALGNYTAAQSSFITALRFSPDDPLARKGLEMCDQVLNLDPLRRGLGGQERFERSVHVLELAIAKIPQCMQATQTGVTADLVNAATAALRKHVPIAGQTEAVEANLDLANKLWKTERATCTSAVAEADRPLELVLAKAAQ